MGTGRLTAAETLGATGIDYVHAYDRDDELHIRVTALGTRLAPRHSVILPSLLGNPFTPHYSRFLFGIPFPRDCPEEGWGT